MNDDVKAQRDTPVNLEPGVFRDAGHRLVDLVADFYASLPARPVTPGETSEKVRELLGTGGLPATGTPVAELFERTAQLLFDHSLHIGHPRFWGYITSSAAPVGALADMLAAAVNPNVARWDVSPVATEIEAQTIRWLAELVGFPTDCGGLMVSGGNMANFQAFIAARRAKSDWNVRREGLYRPDRRFTCYCSADTHTWIEKAADVTGLGTDAIRWIPTDAERRLDVNALDERVRQDRADGFLPFLVVGTAGTTATGAIDPLVDIAALCREHDLWFHVDGAYGAPAAALPDAPPDLAAIARADSLAMDPHKWLYSPLEAACVLVRDEQALRDAFGYEPSFYQVERREGAPGIDYYTLGMQNSRGFRALKVWLSLQHVGRDGYVRSIGQDIALARRLYDNVREHPELEACTQHLSITTFRYVPPRCSPERLNELNRRLVARLQRGGEVFVSNAILDDRYLLRACVVNFRTTAADIDALPEIVVREGRRLHAAL